MKSGKLVGTLGERFHRKLRFESLESRRLLAAITPVSNTSTFPNSAAVQFHTHWDRNGNGTIDANELTTCSGTLVSDYQVLTAGHCLYDSERGGWASDVYVHAGRLSEHNRPWGEAAGVQFHVHPGYLRTESKFYDVGIVVLDRNLGDFTGHFGIGTLQNPLHKNTPKPPYAVDLQVLHYPAKHSNNGVDYTGSVQQWGGINYRLWSNPEWVGQDAFYTVNLSDMWTAEGSSGAGLFTTDHQVVGVLSGGSDRPLGSDGIDRYVKFGLWNEWPAFPVEWITDRLGEDARPVDRPMLVNHEQWFSSSSNVPTSSVVTGQQFTTSARVFNAGTTTASNVRVRFRLSSDVQYDTSDLLLGDATISSIAPFNSRLVNFNFQVPSQLPGTYHIVWSIDPDNTIREYTPTFHNTYIESQGSNDHHYGRSSRIRYEDDNNEPDDTAGFANLLPADTWLSTWSGLGRQFDDDFYRITVPQDQRNVIVDLSFLLRHGDIDLELLDANGNRVAAASSTSDNESLNVIVSSGGTYFLRVHFSDLGNLYDLRWRAVRPADLRGEGLSSSTAVREGGDSFDVSFSVRNDGGNAGAFDVHFYASRDAVIDPSTDLTIGSYSFSSLSGQTSSGTRTSRVRLPAQGSAFWNGDGTYYIGMVIDRRGEVQEADESDNFALGIGIDTAAVEVVVHPFGTFAVESVHVNEIRLPQFDSSRGTLNRVEVSVLNATATTRQATIPPVFPPVTDVHTVTFPLGPYQYATTTQPMPISGTHSEIVSSGGITKTWTSSAELAPFLGGTQTFSLPAGLRTSPGFGGHTHEVDDVHFIVDTFFYFDPPPADVFGSGFTLLNTSLPLDGKDNRAFDLQYTIANSGPGPAPAFDVRFYISEDPHIAPGDATLATVTIEAGLAAGDSITRVQRLGLPHAASTFWKGDRTYYVGMIVDHDGSVNETDISNNGNRGQGLDMLDVDVIVKPPGTEVAFLVTGGEVRVPRFDPALGVLRRVELSSQLLEGATNYAGQVYPPEIPSNHAHVFRFDVGPLHYDAIALPMLSGFPHPILPVSSPRVVLSADLLSAVQSGDLVFPLPANVTSSTELGHSHLLTAAVFLTEAWYYFDALPNLRIEDFAIAEPVEPGEQITVEYRALNSGPGASANFRVALYLSDDPTVTASDRLLAVHEHSNLAALELGDRQAISAAVPRLDDPFWTRSGQFWIGVIVDALDDVEEADEADNVAVRQTGAIDFPEQIEPADLGMLGYQAFASLPPGEHWHRVVAAETGPLTVAASGPPGTGLRAVVYRPPGGSQAAGGSFLWSDVVRGEVGRSIARAGELRLDVAATEGDVLLVRVISDEAIQSLAFANLLQIEDGTAHIYGSAGDDRFATSAFPTPSVSVNGLIYRLDGEAVQAVSLHGSGGRDTYDIDPFIDWPIAIEDARVAERTTLDVHAHGTRPDSTDRTVSVPGRSTISVNNDVDLRLLNARYWENPLRPLDSNNDRFITPLDALVIINELNANGSGKLPDLDNETYAPPYFLDTDGNGFVTPLDALLIINHLNVTNWTHGADGESEATVATSPPPMEPPPPLNSLAVATLMAFWPENHRRKRFAAPSPDVHAKWLHHALRD